MWEVKVLGTTYSPFVNRVITALKLKGVEYEYIEENLENKSPLLVQYNPLHKKVPVLVHQEKPIAESMIILEYIDEVWGSPPKHPHERAMARFWAKFIDEKCMPTMWRACWSSGEEQEKLKEQVREALEYLENEINGKKYFGGDNIGVVDLGANFIAYWVPILSEIVGLELTTVKDYPNLCTWASDYCSHPIIKDNLPHKDGMTARFKPN